MARSGINCRLPSTRRLPTVPAAANSRSPIPRRHRPSPPRRRVPPLLLLLLLPSMATIISPTVPLCCRSAGVCGEALHSSVRSLIQRTLLSVAVSNLLMRRRASPMPVRVIRAALSVSLATEYITPCKACFASATEQLTKIATRQMLSAR